MKKVYNAPYLKVVEVKNDIIATSAEVDNTTVDNGFGRAPRRNIWSDGESVEDMDF